MKKNKKNGFTLVESLIAVSISAIAAISVITFSVGQSNDAKSKFLSNDINAILNGIDQKLSVDGYDIISWNKQNWNTDTLNLLINEELQATNSKCGSGTWSPINGDNSLSLVPCDLFKKINYPLDINVKIEKDHTGFINNSIIDYSFKNNKDFNEYFKYVQKAFFYAKQNHINAKTGTVFYSYLNKDTNGDVSLSKCISLKDKCVFRTILNRQGGSENLKVDGSNSMIKSNVSFISEKGQSPLKCVKWKINSSGNWVKYDSDKKGHCGIGFYNYDGSTIPSNVDVLASNGIFENILLNKSCKTYIWDETTKSLNENTYKLMPCGMSKDGSEIVQLVDNIQANNGYFKKLYANDMVLSELKLNDLESKLITADRIIIRDNLKSNIITTNLLNAQNIISSQVSSFDIKTKKLNVSESASIRTIDTSLNIKKDLIVDTNIKASNISSSNDLSVTNNIIGNRLNAREYINISGIAVNGSSCSQNGLIGRENNGALLNCVNGRWTGIGTSSSKSWHSVPSSDNNTYYNNHGSDMAINAWGGGYINRCDVQLFINGIHVGSSSNHNPDWSKSCFVSGIVPKGGSYKLISRPYNSPAGGIGAVGFY